MPLDYVCLSVCLSVTPAVSGVCEADELHKQVRSHVLKRLQCKCGTEQTDGWNKGALGLLVTN